MKKELEKLTSKGITALAKDLKISGYSSMKKPELVKLIAKRDHGGNLDLSKYPVLKEFEEKAKTLLVKKPKAGRRTVIVSNGRR